MARKTGSHSEITGPRVQAAALRLIAQHGFAAVSMRQIAAEVGVQAGALYNYTNDKQTLLFDLLRTHMEHLLNALGTLPETGTPMARLEAFCRFHIAYHIERPDEVFISYMELRNLSADNFAAIEALRRRYESHLDAILKDGQAAGHFALDDARVTTFAVIAMLTGVNTWYREDGPLSKTDLADLYWTLVRRAVAA
ncbi:MAG: TetR/AcrR family transcriptional regulator [Pseudomonadota bacterium]